MSYVYQVLLIHKIKLTLLCWDLVNLVFAKNSTDFGIITRYLCFYQVFTASDRACLIHDAFTLSWWVVSVIVTSFTPTLPLYVFYMFFLLSSRPNAQPFFLLLMEGFWLVASFLHQSCDWLGGRGGRGSLKFWYKWEIEYRYTFSKPVTLSEPSLFLIYYQQIGRP